VEKFEWGYRGRTTDRKRLWDGGTLLRSASAPLSERMMPMGLEGCIPSARGSSGAPSRYQSGKDPECPRLNSRRIVACQRDSRRCPSSVAAYDHLLGPRGHREQEAGRPKRAWRPTRSQQSRLRPWMGAWPGISVVAGRGGLCRLSCKLVRRTPLTSYNPPLSKNSTRIGGLSSACLEPAGEKGGKNSSAMPPESNPGPAGVPHLGETCRQPRARPSG